MLLQYLISIFDIITVLDIFRLLCFVSFISTWIDETNNYSIFKILHDSLHTIRWKESAKSLIIFWMCAELSIIVCTIHIIIWIVYYRNQSSATFCELELDPDFCSVRQSASFCAETSLHLILKRKCTIYTKTVV